MDVCTLIELVNRILTYKQMNFKAYLPVQIAYYDPKFANPALT